MTRVIADAMHTAHGPNDADALLRKIFACPVCGEAAGIDIDSDANWGGVFVRVVRGRCPQCGRRYKFGVVVDYE